MADKTKGERKKKTPAVSRVAAKSKATVKGRAVAGKPARKTAGKVAAKPRANPNSNTIVIINTPIYARTRTGLTRLKERLGLRNQGQVINMLVEEALRRS